MYRGYCAHNIQVGEARLRVLGMQRELLELLETDTVLAKKSRTKMIKFFMKSLQIIEDDETWQKKVLGACRS